MPPERKDAIAVEFVLLTGLKAVQVTIAEGGLQRDPTVRVRIRGTPSGHDVEITIVACELEKWLQPLPGPYATARLTA